MTAPAAGRSSSPSRAGRRAKSRLHPPAGSGRRRWPPTASTASPPATRYAAWPGHRRDLRRRACARSPRRWARGSSTDPGSPGSTRPWRAGRRRRAPPGRRRAPCCSPTCRPCVRRTSTPPCAPSVRCWTRVPDTRQAVVPDAAGTGTVLLTAPRRTQIRHVVRRGFGGSATRPSAHHRLESSTCPGCAPTSTTTAPLARRGRRSGWVRATARPCGEPPATLPLHAGERAHLRRPWRRRLGPARRRRARSDRSPAGSSTASALRHLRPGSGSASTCTRTDDERGRAVDRQGIAD